MRWACFIVIGAAALLASCGLAAEYPDFSANQYRLEGHRTLPDGNASGPAVYFRDGPALRYEGPLEGRGISTVIYDPAREATYLLRSTASVRRRQFAGAQPRQIAVRLSAGETPQPLETSWAALGAENVRSVGGCRAAGERGRLWRPRRPIARNVTRTACITPDGIVLHLMENDTVLFEATAVGRGPQPRALFEIPETYRIMDDAELALAEEEPSGG